MVDNTCYHRQLFEFVYFFCSQELSLKTVVFAPRIDILCDFE